MRKTHLINFLVALLIVFSLTGCSSPKFETINVEGTESTFSMPVGYKDGPLGMGHQYRGKIDDATFRIVVTPRTKTAQDQASGLSDEMKIKEHAAEIMGAIKKGIRKQGHEFVDRFDGIVPNSHGYTVQYTVAVDDRTVYNRFYITPQLIFYAEAACDDPGNENVAQFFELLKP